MGMGMGMGKREGSLAFKSFEVAYRAGFLCIMVGLPAILAPYVQGASASWYFAFPIIGTAILFLATYPLGHTALGADLRGILGWAILFEIALALVFSIDAVVIWYRALKPWFKPVEYGFWMVLVARMFWPLDGLSYPFFDFVRPLIGGSSDHKKLSLGRVFLGYAMLGGAFFCGMLLGFFDVQLSITAVFAVPGVLLMFYARHDEVAVEDLLEINR